MKNFSKMNHNFDYNCTEWFFDHPRHGTIPCALADRDISRGEELFLHYGYDPNNCPVWYRQAAEDYLSHHPGLDIWQVADHNRLVSQTLYILYLLGSMKSSKTTERED